MTAIRPSASSVGAPADRHIWERWTRLEGIRSNIAGNALRQLRRSTAMPHAVTAADLGALVDEQWDTLMLEAIGQAGTGTLAARLTELEATSRGSDLEAQSVAYLGATLANKVRNEVARPGYAPDDIDQVVAGASAVQLSVEDEAIGRANAKDALSYLRDELSDDAKRVAAVSAIGVNTRDEQQAMTGLTERRARKARNELTAARALLRDRLGAFFGAFVLAGSAMRRMVSPQQAEAAGAAVAGAGGVGLGLKIGTGMTVSALAIVGALKVPDLRSPSPPDRTIPARSEVSRTAVPSVVQAAQRQNEVIVAEATRAEAAEKRAAARRTAARAAKRRREAASAADREFGVGAASTTASNATNTARDTAAPSAAGREFAVPPDRAPPGGAAASEFP